MKDPFNRAKQMHAGAARMPAATAAPPAPMAQTLGQQVAAPAGHNIGALLQKAGLGHVKMSGDATTDRAALVDHLQKKYGPGYASHPEAQQLLAALSPSSDVNPQALPTHQAKTMKALLGHP